VYVYGLIRVAVICSADVSSLSAAVDNTTSTVADNNSSFENDNTINVSS